MTRCRTCELTARRDAGDAPDWDSIARTPEWDVVHAYDTSLEGWMVLVLRRHATSIAQLTEVEATALGRLSVAVSGGLSEITGCAKTYLAQFAEHPEHRHVHVHVIPRATNLPDDEIGPRIFTRLGADPDGRVSEARMNEIGRAMRDRLIAWGRAGGGLELG
ncbi:MAG TPA: hypothetical protein VMD59_16975 [Acidimicrobiales bacterium]|nr:hypothetical protein [Acidimicrobiales bacterium]